MKKVGVAVLVIILVAVAFMVFLVINKPASIFMRKAFQQLKEIRLTTATDQKFKDQIIESLNDKNKQAAMREDSLLRVNLTMHVEIITLKDNETKLVTTSQALKKQLADLQTSHQQTSVSDQVILWDRQTEGQKVSLLIDYNEQEMVITEPSRIADANLKIIQSTTLAQLHDNDQQLIANNHQQIVKLESINANLEGARIQCHEQKKVEIEKREICEKSVNDAMKRAKRIATGGGIAIILSFAILLL
jgi:hypothetical protein